MVSEKMHDIWGGNLPLDEMPSKISGGLTHDLHRYIVPDHGVDVSASTNNGPKWQTHHGIRGTFVRSYISSNGLFSVWKSVTRGLL